MRTFAAAVVLLLGVGLSPGAAGADDALTNEDVIRLTEAGIGAPVIVARIRAFPTAFDLSVDQLVALAEAGVDDDVLAAMLAATPGPVPERRAGGATAPTRAASAPETPRNSAQPQATPDSTFRESLHSRGEGPEMVVIPAGRFRMGCLSNDEDCRDLEKPVHEVTIGAPFALSVYELTFEDYDRFTYPNKVADAGWGRERRPVVNVSWDDAQDYVEWLSSQTGAEYRLPSEAEWEYSARAGSTTKYHWGDGIGTNRANCDGCGSQWDDRQTAPVGSFRPNGFGLYDMHGNVREWVADCWNGSYQGAPSDGSAWLQGDCAHRVLRGGSWGSFPGSLRAAYRFTYPYVVRDNVSGFRVARTLTP